MCKIEITGSLTLQSSCEGEMSVSGWSLSLVPGMQCSSAAPPAPHVGTLIRNERPRTPDLCTLCFPEKGLEGFPQLNKNKDVGKVRFAYGPGLKVEAPSPEVHSLSHMGGA